MALSRELHHDEAGIGKMCDLMLYAEDAQSAMEEAATVGVDLAYTIPEEGSNVWYDGWVIPKYAYYIRI